MVYILGLTGGLASGKSTVSSFLKAAGAAIIDADAIVHVLQGPNTQQTQMICAHLGKEVLHPDGRINRAVLAGKAGADPAVLPFLESVLHPAVQAEEGRQIQEAVGAGAQVVVLDVPLLFEAGGYKKCDGVALCWSPLHVRKARAFERQGMREEKWKALLKRRWPDKRAKAQANFIIPTSVSLAKTKQTTLALYKSLAAQKGKAYAAYW